MKKKEIDETAEQAETPEKPKLTPAEELKVNLYFWLQALVLALVTLILMFTFVGRIIGVDGNSMNPTLHNGDMLLLRSIGYTPKQGDIIVLTKDFEQWEDQPIVKRVIAVGGQTVRVDYDVGKVFVDDVPLDEPYILEAMRYPTNPTLSFTGGTVPEGSVFVLGDNRNGSSDSRDVELGFVDNRYVLGEAIMILFPFSNFSLL